MFIKSILTGSSIPFCSKLKSNYFFEIEMVSQPWLASNCLASESKTIPFCVCDFFFIEVQLIYNIFLISAVQQSDSVIHSFLIFFSIMVYHRILNTVLYAISRTLLFIHSIYNSLHLLTPNSYSIPPPTHTPLATTSLFSMSVILFLFCR